MDDTLTLNPLETPAPPPAVIPTPAQPPASPPPAPAPVQQPVVQQPQEPVKPKPPASLEQMLAEQANNAIAAGADVTVVNAMLEQRVRYVRANPEVAIQGRNALQAGGDQNEIARILGEKINKGAPAAGTPESAQALNDRITTLAQERVRTGQAATLERAKSDVAREMDAPRPPVTTPTRPYEEQYPEGRGIQPPRGVASLNLQPTDKPVGSIRPDKGPMDRPFAAEATQVGPYTGPKGTELPPDGWTPKGMGAAVLRHAVGPMMENPLSTVLMMGGGAYTGIPMLGAMAKREAEYVGQAAAEATLDPATRKFAEQDPERIPGGEAAVNAAMIALPMLVHGALPDIGKAVPEAFAGVREKTGPFGLGRPGKLIQKGIGQEMAGTPPVTPAALASNANARFQRPPSEKQREELQQTEPVEQPATTIPRAPDLAPVQPEVHPDGRQSVQLKVPGLEQTEPVQPPRTTKQIPTIDARDEVVAQAQAAKAERAAADAKAWAQRAEEQNREEARTRQEALRALTGVRRRPAGEIPEAPAKIRAAAIQFPDGSIHEGPSHWPATEAAIKAGKLPAPEHPSFERLLSQAVDGFTDERGRFLTRDEAARRMDELEQPLPDRGPGRFKASSEDILAAQKQGPLDVEHTPVVDAPTEGTPRARPFAQPDIGHQAEPNPLIPERGTAREPGTTIEEQRLARQQPIAPAQPPVEPPKGLEPTPEFTAPPATPKTPEQKTYSTQRPLSVPEKWQLNQRISSIQRDVERMLMTSGKQPGPVAQNGAKILAAKIRTEAVRTGRDPVDLYNEMRLGVRGGVEAETAPPGSTHEQAVTLRKKTETLKKYGLKPGGRYSNREVATALEARQKEKFGTIGRNDRTPAASKKMAKWMAAEIKHELETPGESAAGWYTHEYQKAIDAIADSHKFPDLKTDKNQRDIFTAITAVLSDGNEAGQNLKMAADVYANYRKTGELKLQQGSARGETSMQPNLDRFSELVKQMGPEEASKYLLTERPIKELVRIATEQGRTDTAKEISKSGYQADFVMPMAAIEFGPKLGAFYSNLMGKANYLTMDRWWSRTFNRYRGDVVPRPTAQGLARFRELIGKPELTDQETMEATRPYEKSYRLKKYDNGTEAEIAGNTIFKAAFVSLNDAPWGPTDRTFMVQTVDHAIAELKKEGIEVTRADAQAILWYFEKKLYGQLTNKKAKGTIPINYADVARTMGGEEVPFGLSVEDAAAAGDREFQPEQGKPPLSLFQGAQARGMLGGEETARGRAVPAAPTTDVSGPVGRVDPVADEAARPYTRRGDLAPGSVRVLGSDVRAVGHYDPDPATARALGAMRAKDGGPGRQAPPAIELDASHPQSVETFVKAITSSKNSGPFGKAVYVYSPEEYSGMRLFLSKTGESGFALKGDDIVSVFSRERGGQAMHRLAIEQGGKTLDAFDTVLPEIYARNGMRVVSRLAWDESQAPEGWDHKTFEKYNGGRPDVVFMVHDPEFTGDRLAGKRASSYDEAVALQQQALQGEPEPAQSRTFHQSDVPKEAPNPTRPDASETGLPGFYSRLGRAIKAAPHEKATAEQWSAALSKNVAKGEREWTGVDAFLEENKGKVLTRKQVQDVFDQGKVQLETTQLGVSEADRARLKEIDTEMNGVLDEMGPESGLPGYMRRDTPRNKELTKKFADLQDERGDILRNEEPKYGEGNYTVPGGKNHREVVTGEKSVEPYDTSNDIHFGQTMKGRVIGWFRASDRQVPGDKGKTLHLEENQSKRHQDARTEGWRDGAIEYNRLLTERNALPPGSPERTAINERILAMSREEGGNPTAVPDAPFKKTEEWALLQVKRAIEEAVKGGYERISWSTGEQNAGHYDLSKQVDKLTYDPATEKLVATKGGHTIHSGTYDPKALASVLGKDVADRLLATELPGKSTKGQAFGQAMSWTADPTGRAGLYNVQDQEGNILGQYRARTAREAREQALAKYMEKGADASVHVLTGQDLKVGGQGMKQFYDVMMPNIIKDYAKKLGVKLDIEKVQATGGALTDLAVVKELSGYDYGSDRASSRLLSVLRSEMTTSGRDFESAMERLDNRFGDGEVDSRTLEEIRDNFEDFKSRNKPDANAGNLSFKITPELKAKIEGEGQPLWQTDVTRGPRGKITFGEDGSTTIDFLSKADESTFVHELGHLFLEGMGKRAGEEGIPQQIKDDFATIRKWVGAKGDAPFTTEQHEQFARGFEKYLAEGEAPSAELEGPFARFKQWLTGIYKQLTDLNVELTPEVKKVFDRLLATDEEIAAKEAGKREAGAKLPEGEATGKPLEPNRTKYANDEEIQGQLDDAIDALTKKGVGKTIVPIAEGRARANELAKALGADPLQIDLSKAGRLSGEEITGLAGAAQQHMKQIVEWSRELSNPDLTLDQRQSLSDLIDQAHQTRNQLVEAVTKAKSQKGRDLNFLKQMAQHSLDPDVWEQTARTMAARSDRVLSDHDVMLIRRLAKEAENVCL